MTVKELRDALATRDDDLPIVLYYDEYDDYSPCGVHVRELELVDEFDDGKAFVSKVISEDGRSLVPAKESGEPLVRVVTLNG